MPLERSCKTRLYRLVFARICLKLRKIFILEILNSPIRGEICWGLSLILITDSVSVLCLSLKQSTAVPCGHREHVLMCHIDVPASMGASQIFFKAGN